MKVLHIISGLSVGGAETMLAKLIRHSSKVVNHAVISLRSHGEMGNKLRKVGIPVYELGIQNFVPTLDSLKKLFKYTKKENPDIIQGWMYHGNAAASAVKLFAGKPVVYNIRHSLYDIKDEKKTTQWIIKLNCLLSKGASSVIYNSQVSRDHHEDYGFSSNNSVVIPNGFDVTKFKSYPERRDSIRSELNIPKRSILIGQVGRNHFLKDHGNFIRAASKVKEQKQNIHFLIVGRDVSTDSSLKKLVEELGLQGYITLEGQRNDIEKVWSAVDIGCNSSRSEAFPNVVGEAMLCEKPCIVTDVGDSSYVVGETGKVVPPQDSSSLSKAMVEMINLSDNEKDKLGMMARKRIVENFSIESISDTYIKLYKTVVKN